MPTAVKHRGRGKRREKKKIVINHGYQSGVYVMPAVFCCDAKKKRRKSSSIPLSHPECQHHKHVIGDVTLGRKIQKLLTCQTLHGGAAECPGCHIAILELCYTTQLFFVPSVNNHVIIGLKLCCIIVAPLFFFSSFFLLLFKAIFLCSLHLFYSFAFGSFLLFWQVLTW